MKPKLIQGVSAFKEIDYYRPVGETGRRTAGIIDMDSIDKRNQKESVRASGGSTLASSSYIVRSTRTQATIELIFQSSINPVKK